MVWTQIYLEMGCNLNFFYPTSCWFNIVDLTYSLIYIKLSLNNQNLTQFLSASISVMIIINSNRMYSYKMFYTLVNQKANSFQAQVQMVKRKFHQRKYVPDIITNVISKVLETLLTFIFHRQQDKIFLI